MRPSPSARYGNRFLAWCGLIVGVCVALPPLLRVGDEGWTGPNIFFLAAGTILVFVWAFRLIFLNREKQYRKSTDAENVRDTNEGL